MSCLKLAVKGKTVEVSRGGECIAWLRNRGGRWTLYRLEDALTMADLANIRGYAFTK
jgi:hypothetical protein